MALGMQANKKGQPYLLFIHEKPTTERQIQKSFTVLGKEELSANYFTSHPHWLLLDTSNSTTSKELPMYAPSPSMAKHQHVNKKLPIHISTLNFSSYGTWISLPLYSEGKDSYLQACRGIEWENI